MHDAGTRLDAALAEWQSSLVLQMLKARVLQESGQLDAARAHCQKMCVRFPQSAQPDKLLAILALGQGDAELAAKHASAAEQKGLQAAELFNLQVRIARARGDRPAQRQWLEQLAALKDQPDPTLGRQFARLRAGSRRRSAGRDVLEQPSAAPVSDAKAHEGIARAAIAAGDLDRAEMAFSSLSTLQPDDPAWLSDRLFFLRAAGRSLEANEQMRLAIERGLGGYRLFRKVSAAALPRDLQQHVLRWATSVKPGAPAAERAKAAEALADFGVPLQPQLLNIEAPGKQESVRLSRLDWLKHAPPDHLLKRQVLQGASDEEAVIAPGDRAETVALVFTGLADRAMVPLPSLDRYLAALGISAVYLRDFSRLMFLRGISSKAADLAGTVRWLGDLLGQWGTRRILSLGTSAGGYAAIHYGMALGADRIVAFSTPTNLGADFNREDGRARLVALKVQTLPEELLDLRPLVMRNAGRTPIHLVYGAGMRQDAHHARHVEGLPGVHLHPLEGFERHDSLVWLAGQGKLLSFLSETFS